MSVIQIPSKNIFSIDNQKVVDNQIDKIEVSAKEPTIVNDTQNIYNKTIEGAFVDGATQKGEAVANGADIGAYPIYEHVNVAYIEATPIYITKTIIVPKRIENMSVIKVLTGEDKNGFANIKYTIRGNIGRGTSQGDVTVLKGSDFGINKVILSEVTVQKPTDVIVTDYGTVYSLSKTETDIEYTSEYKVKVNLAETDMTVTATFSLKDDTNVLTTTAIPTSDGKNFEISLNILCGLKINKLKGNFSRLRPDYNYGFNVPLTGEYEEYIPTQVDISFYGDVIKLDLQDKTVKISDGSNVFSFDGNELMQTTTTFPQEESITRVVSGRASTHAYGDYYVASGIVSIGKGEVADLQFDTGANRKTIRYDSDTGYIYWDIYSLTPDILVSGTITCTLLTPITMQEFYRQVITQYQDGKEIATIRCSIDDYYDENGEKVIDIKSGRMTFHQYDKVIPYVFGADGKDRPMSQYKDGSPKVFQVLSTRPFGDGAVWQELVLVESKQ